MATTAYPNRSTIADELAVLDRTSAPSFVMLLRRHELQRQLAVIMEHDIAAQNKERRALRARRARPGHIIIKRTPTGPKVTCVYMPPPTRPGLITIKLKTRPATSVPLPTYTPADIAAKPPRRDAQLSARVGEPNKTFRREVKEGVRTRAQIQREEQRVAAEKQEKAEPNPASAEIRDREISEAAEIPLPTESELREFFPAAEIPNLTERELTKVAEAIAGAAELPNLLTESERQADMARPLSEPVPHEELVETGGMRASKDDWTKEEERQFDKALRKFPMGFKSIAATIPGRSWQDCSDFFWRRDEEREHKRELARLRRKAMSEKQALMPKPAKRRHRREPWVPRKRRGNAALVADSASAANSAPAERQDAATESIPKVDSTTATTESVPKVDSTTATTESAPLVLTLQPVHTRGTQRKIRIVQISPPNQEREVDVRKLAPDHKND